MFNKVILVGNLTRDVELRYLPSGSALAKIGLATSRKFKRQDGAMGEEVCFIDVNLFGRTAEVANQYLRKGSKILIEGRLVLESWVDQNGQKRSRHTVTADSMQMIDTRNNTPSNYGQEESFHEPAQTGYQQNGGYYAQQPQQPQQPSHQQPSYQHTEKTQKFSDEGYNNKIPEIDVDDDDIPF